MMPLTHHSWTFSICLTKIIWRTTRSGQVTGMHSPYAASGWWSPECWSNEIVIKCRKLGESRVCSRAGWEQVTCAVVTVVLLKDAILCSQNAELSWAHGLWGECEPAAVLMLESFAWLSTHWALLPLVSPISRASFILSFWLFASCPSLSHLHRCQVKMIGAEHWLFSVEYLLYICSYFIWGFQKKRKRKNDTSSPGTCSMFRVKAGHEKGHFPFLSNWL